MTRPRMVLLLACALFAVGCDDNPSTDADADADADGDADSDADGDADADADSDADGDRDADAEVPPTLDFEIHFPIFDTPEDPLADSAVESCPVYREEQCEGGTLRRCEVYDTATTAFVDDGDLDPLFRRALLYDRWYDLWDSPSGQTAERRYSVPMPAGTPESVWSDVANFDRYTGGGDSAIWTGTALNAYILRYLVTGTEADYRRMEDKVRVMLHFFDVTGIPGYLARYHYLNIDSDARPRSNDVYLEYQREPSHTNRPIEDPESLDFLPEEYLTGVADASGTVYTGTPMWSGAPTIDQMNGPMVAFPMVYGLLRDESLREQITHHMTCYLRRLQRIEIINLQDNEMALEAVQNYFAGQNLNLDEGDPDFTQIDHIVMYGHPQINELNEDVFDRSCPDHIQMTPSRLLDASSPDFLLDILELIADLDAKHRLRENGIDHFYVPSVRGGDAMHMMHLAAMAYAFTGDEQYRRFLEDELLGNIRTAEVAMTTGALIPPDWCRSFFGTNITVGPMWAFINLLGDSPLREHMQRVMDVEEWQKETYDLGNVNFDIMFAGVVPESIAGADRATALDYAVQQLELFGGNGGVLDDPRRRYERPYDDIVAAMPDDTMPICPTEEQRHMCEDGVTAFGLTMAGEPITHECTGAPGECVMEDGLCASTLASGPLPPALRRWADYLWQRNPYAIGEDGDEGRTQSPGVDLIEEFWMARFYDFVHGGAGQVLAWHTVGDCP